MPVPLVQYYYRGLERVGSWVPGGSVGRDQLAMAAKVRRHWFNPCRLGSRGHLGADFSLLLYTDLITNFCHRYAFLVIFGDICGKVSDVHRINRFTVLCL